MKKLNLALCHKRPVLNKPVKPYEVEYSYYRRQSFPESQFNYATTLLFPTIPDGIEVRFIAGVNDKGIVVKIKAVDNRVSV